MRKIELKTIPMGEHGGRQWPPLKFATAICDILDSKEGGMSVAEMRQCSRIIGVMRAAEGHALIEEADWSYLCQRVDDHRFVICDDAILAMVDAVKNAKTVVVAEAKAAA